MRNTLFVILMLSAVMAMASCSDDVKNTDTDTDSFTDTSVVDDNSLIKDLSDEEMSAFCGEMFTETMTVSSDLRDVIAEQFCAISGAGAAQSVFNVGGTAEQMAMACDTTVQSCKTGELGSTDSLLQGMSTLQSEGALCTGLQDIFADCDASTKDMADCYLALLEWQLNQTETELMNLPECGDYTPEYFESTATADTAPALKDIPFQCATIALKCPDMVSSLMNVPGIGL